MTQPFLPSTLPLVPLPPPQLLYPYLRASLSLSSAQMSVVLDSIGQNNKMQKMEGRWVGVVPVVEIERRVGRWATAARVIKVEKDKEEGMFNLVVEGLARIRLPRSLPPVLSILPPHPLPISTYSLPLPDLTSTPSISLVPYLEHLLPTAMQSRITALPPSMLCDLLVTILGLEWEVRVDLLGVSGIEERTQRMKEILLALLAERGIAPPPDSTSPTSSKVYSPSTALVKRSPQRIGESPNHNAGLSQATLPEDLQPLFHTLANRHSAGELPKSVQKTITRELARLAKIPPQSAEYGVGKTYLEWLLVLPWRKVSAMKDEMDLAAMTAELEKGHEGLVEVKRRVVEYVAVYRLKKKRWQEQLDKVKLEATASAPTTSDTAASRAISSSPPAFDPQTASHLLDLIPRNQVQALNNPAPAPTPPPTPLEDDDDDDEHRPAKNVFRDKGPILLLVGPPGVGKTSIAKSLADALGRKFWRISLGGVRDEAEIRGHRRTYVGALPGLLVQALRKTGTSNPLILLDELDKVGTSNFHGDPAAALLETLDPAQNWSFHDHYLGDVPIDLSQILFIATANTLETISAPLLDRCEVIECPGYITPEKIAIARKHLLPRQIDECGLSSDGVIMSDEVIERVVTEYTREAGVRGLEKELGKVCRTKAVKFSAATSASSSSPLPTSARQETYDPKVTVHDLEEILGSAKFEAEVSERELRPGMATGMAYRGSGMGGILLIESMLVPGGKGRLVLTGSLGEVIKESAELGLTWVKSRAVALGITSRTTEDPLQGVDIHLHLPSGAVKKDGPSAGVAMVLAFVSLLTGRSVPGDLACTGEITLRGAVTAVGGIREKVLGAHRAGIKRIILPERNRKDAQSDLPEQVKKEVEIVYVRRIEEVLEHVWGAEVWAVPAPGTGTGGVRSEARL